MALNNFPPGFKFAPSDEDLITHFLIPKIQGDRIQTTFIEEENVYAIEPQQLNWPLVPYLKSQERYYFVKRERMATKTGAGKRVKRTLESDIGFWRLSSGEHKIKDYGGNVIGVYSCLNFWAYIHPTKKVHDLAIKCARWLMTEYKLPENKFQEWVICKIKDTQREKPTLQLICNQQVGNISGHYDQLRNDKVLSISSPSKSSSIIQSVHQDSNEDEVLRRQDFTTIADQKPIPSHSYQRNYDLPQDNHKTIETEGDNFCDCFIKTVAMNSLDDTEGWFKEEFFSKKENIPKPQPLRPQNIDQFASLPMVVEYSLKAETTLLEDWLADSLT